MPPDFYFRIASPVTLFLALAFACACFICAGMLFHTDQMLLDAGKQQNRWKLLLAVALTLAAVFALMFSSTVFLVLLSREF